MKTMRKFIWISLLILISCGTRKKDVEKKTENTELKTEASRTQKTNLEATSETSIDYAKFFQEIGLKIKSSGSDYSFQIGDFKFAGNADVEFSNKKEETKIKWIEKIKTIYKTETTYKTVTVYKSKTTDKKLHVESKRPMFWMYVSIALGIIAFILVIKNEFKIKLWQ